ncbi:MAG: NfeD family protein [Burkholderiaceae bacterium]
MAESSVWWVCAGVAVALELLTGTFYLLMLGIGLVAAALASHLGASMVVQLVLAAAVGGGAVIAWHLHQSRRPNEPPATANPNVNLDVGETVQVDGWNPDGTATIRYRGANWTAQNRSSNALSTGAHRVVEVIGSRLMVEKIQQP